MSIAIFGDPEVLIIESGVEYAVGLEPDAETVVVTAGEQGPPGVNSATGDFFQVANRFSELATAQAKAEARANLDLQTIDGGTFN
ncbi:hypothetical protein [Stutzerimonas stutzeri]|uniref:hypothetical protein n=1 Tax=Stutzerimonas stutzeri TaxID=316 RepID=UPI000C9AA44F|nr:hypothetical protein [Stutzerimonas stutzeri]PNG11861.1 hypothetical protein CXK97_19240 [Stutzerimonas stutzeri]